jgi:hypothetical protein
VHSISTELKAVKPCFVRGAMALARQCDHACLHYSS